MNIHEKINEVNKYFTEKILRKDCKVTHIEEHSVSLDIDGYPVALWLPKHKVVNDEIYTSTYPYSHKEDGTVIEARLMLEFTNEQKINIHKIYRPLIDKKYK